MMHDDMMVGAFSHPVAVGKLRQKLTGVPIDALVNVPHYGLDVAAYISHYYLRERNTPPEYCLPPPLVPCRVTVDELIRLGREQKEMRCRFKSLPFAQRTTGSTTLVD